MKRIILLVTMMVFLFPYMGHAQLNITNKSDKIERISSARTGLISLNKQGDIYYVGLHSSNQFDNPGIFYLGKDKESSLATLNDLLTLQETLKKGECVDVKDISGKKISISQAMTGNLAFQFSDMAGICYLHKNEIKKFINALK